MDINMDQDDTELVFDFEIDAFKSASGRMLHPFINIEGDMIHDDELKRLLRSDKQQDVERRKMLIVDIVQNDYRDVFKYILLCGYQMDETLNDKGQTALHLAFHHNPGYLLEPNGAFLVPNRTSNVNYTDSDGLTHLHVACVIGNVELVKKLLDNESTNVNASYRFEQGEIKPLHFAALNLRLDIIKLLLEKGADVNATDFLGRTPLHLAAGVCNYRPSYSWIKDWKVVDILLKYQSKVNALDNNGNTPLLSIYQNYFQYDKIFIYYAHTSDTEIQGNERMKIDLVKAQSKKIEILIKQGADISMSNKNGDTIIHCVINSLKALRIPSRAVDISFNDGHHVKIVKNVLNADSNLVNAVNNNKDTSLSLAVSFLSLDIVKTLLKFNVDLKSLKFDGENQNYFQYLCIVPNFQPVQNLISIKELLISNGYQMSARDNLIILKFFVHNFNDCKCKKALDSYDTLLKIMNLLNFGSTAHIEHVLETSDSVLGAIEDSFNYLNKLLIDFVNYLKYIEYASLYLDQQVKESVNKIYQLFELLPKIEFKEPSVELRRMKSKKLKSNISLHEVMMKHPHDIYRYIGRNFDYKCLKDFPVYGNIIRGHFTKSIMRHYIEESMYGYIQKLLFPSLPAVCVHNILYYLTNEDVLNVAIAIIN